MQTSAGTRSLLPHSAGAAIFLLALALRVGVVLFAPEPALSPNAEGAFVGGAERLLAGDGFRDPSYPMFSPPFYAMTIAASFAVFGHHTLPVRLGQAALDAATVLLVLAIGQRIFGRRAGIAAGALAAVYPFTIYSAYYVGTETLFGFLLVALVWVSLFAVSSQSWAIHAAAGLIMGVASLTRGSTQFYPVAWAATLWLAGRRNLAAFARWAIACLCFAAVIAPWAIRNWMVWDSFIPLSTSAAPLLCGASEEFFTIEGRVERMDRYFERLEERGVKRPEHGDLLGWERFYFSAAREKYRDRFEQEGALGMARFFAAKFARLWYATAWPGLAWPGLAWPMDKRVSTLAPTSALSIALRVERDRQPDRQLRLHRARLADDGVHRPVLARERDALAAPEPRAASRCRGRWRPSLLAA